MARHCGALPCLAVALSIVGCGSLTGRDSCTLIGCSDSVTVIVDQPGERPLEACVGAVCSQPSSDRLVLAASGLGRSVEVLVRVAGGAQVARTTAKPTTRRPNGPGCGPVCRSVRLRLTVDDELVPA